MWTVLSDYWQNIKNRLDIVLKIYIIFLLKKLIKKINNMSEQSKKKSIVEQSWDKLSIEKLEDIQENMRGKNNKVKIGLYIQKRIAIEDGVLADVV